MKLIRKKILNQLRLFKFKHKFLRISVSILLKERSERCAEQSLEEQLNIGKCSTFQQEDE
jgi:hypothetical protein